MRLVLHYAVVWCYIIVKKHITFRLVGGEERTVLTNLLGYESLKGSIMLDNCNFDGELKATVKAISHGGFSDDPNYKVMEDLKKLLMLCRWSLGEENIIQMVTKMEIDVDDRFVNSEIYTYVIDETMNTICNMHFEAKKRGLESGIVNIVVKRLKLIYKNI